jgi:hypothetical protein
MDALVTPGGKVRTGAGPADYLLDVLGERITGETATRGPVTAAMERGTALEPTARARYELLRDCRVEQVGFIRCDLPEMGDGAAVGCSPDGLVGAAGGIEIKCPGTRRYIEALASEGPPAEYVVQCQACLWLTGREWWDLCIYTDAPNLPPYVWRLLPEAGMHLAFVQALGIFWRDLLAMEARLVARGARRAASGAEVMSWV